jgi:hypothetical protein
VVIVILDNFHFDLSLVTTEQESGVKGQFGTSIGDGKSVSVDNEQEGAESVQVNAESAELDDEKEVGVEEGEEEKEEESGSGKDAGQDDRKQALAQRIYRSIVKTTLPSLQRVLTKKVHPFLTFLSSSITSPLTSSLRLPSSVLSPLFPSLNSPPTSFSLSFCPFSLPPSHQLLLFDTD